MNNPLGEVVLVRPKGIIIYIMLNSVRSIAALLHHASATLITIFPL